MDTYRNIHIKTSIENEIKKGVYCMKKEILDAINEISIQESMNEMNNHISYNNMVYKI